MLFQFKNSFEEFAVHFNSLTRFDGTGDKVDDVFRVLRRG